MTIKEKKEIACELLTLGARLDELYIRLQGEWVRPPAFDQLALILSGYSATIPFVYEAIANDINADQEEQFRKERNPTIKPKEIPPPDWEQLDS